MTRISARYLVFCTHVVPLLFIGVCALLAIVFFCNADSMAHCLWPIAIGLIGYRGLKFCPPEFSREVWRFGDALIVRGKDIVTRLELADCVNVTESFGRWHRRITLTFRESTEFGTQFTFIPHDSEGVPAFPLWSMSPFAEDLIKRIDAAKQRRDPG